MQKCWKCGKPGEIHRHIGKMEGIYIKSFKPFKEKAQRWYCRECYESVSAQYKRDVLEFKRLGSRLMFERAVRILEKQDVNIYDYEEAIKAVREFVDEHPEKFDSSFEMIAAIVLIDNEVPCKIQYKVGKYRCDFCLPTLKVILEIDGERHKNRRLIDSMRDNDIRAAMGAGWQVVRIETNNLETKADLLVEAIKTVLEERKKKK